MWTGSCASRLKKKNLYPSCRKTSGTGRWYQDAATKEAHIFCERSEARTKQHPVSRFESQQGKDTSEHREKRKGENDHIGNRKSKHHTGDDYGRHERAD